MEQKPINELFFYTFNTWLNLAAGASLDNSVVTDGDSDFILSDVFGQAFPAGTLANPVPFLIQMRDDMTTKQIMNRLTISSLVCSNATSLNPLPVYRLFPSKSTISATVANPNAAAVDIYLTLRGYKVRTGSYKMVNLTGEPANIPGR